MIFRFLTVHLGLSILKASYFSTPSLHTGSLFGIFLGAIFNSKAIGAIPYRYDRTVSNEVKVCLQVYGLQKEKR